MNIKTLVSILTLCIKYPYVEQFISVQSTAMLRTNGVVLALLLSLLRRTFVTGDRAEDDGFELAFSPLARTASGHSAHLLFRNVRSTVYAERKYLPIGSQRRRPGGMCGAAAAAGPLRKLWRRGTRGGHWALESAVRPQVVAYTQLAR